jgi:collagenase-like PrtC family protease
MISYTISARSKQHTTLPVVQYLRESFPTTALNQIDSVFGFVEQSVLYGGRPYLAPELTHDDVQSLYANGIGLRLPLTNHYVAREEYETERNLLEKYHRAGNSVIITNDDLAKWIRNEFPLFHIEASAIKNIDNLSKLEKAFRCYDTVVLPAKANDDTALLESISEKERIRLFLNAGCAYNCPSKICYPSISEMNKYQGAEFRCSQSIIAREVRMHDFDQKKYVDLGFTRFKLLRSAGITGF